jgi:class 3 adenylate cyclase/tetratricopeptide (TPR) repeat protein
VHLYYPENDMLEDGWRRYRLSNHPMPRTLEQADRLARLTKRERLVATRFGEGLTYKEIAQALYVAPATVRSHLAAVYRKLGVRNKAGLINLVADSPLEQPSLPAVWTSASPEPEGYAASPAAGERRQLTVLVCDVAGFRDLSMRLDPEQLRDLVAAYYDICTRAVADLEGHPARIMDVRLQVYFGYPSAHEDDAERAVRAGLRLIDEVAGLQSAAGRPLGLSVGIATGLVVIDEDQSQGRFAVGPASMLAERLQMLAAPGCVLVAPATRRLLAEWFVYEDLGVQRLDGFADPTPIYRVLGPQTLQSRFDALHPRPLTPLVGREEELEILSRRWARAQARAGQAVLLCGEAGIGKSRVVQALQERIAAQPHTCLACQCSPHHTSSALSAVITQLEHAANFAHDDGATTKLDKLESLLNRAGCNLAEIAPWLARLLSIPSAGRYPCTQPTPQRQKEQILSALIDWFASLAAGQPVLLIVEDAHWSDPTTLELLGLLLERLPQLSMLLVLTFRPEFTPPWSSEAHVTGLTLNRLSPEQMMAMVDRISAGKHLADELRTQIAARADGVPLFVEELTKAILGSNLLREQGDRYALSEPLACAAIPTTLQDSLVARLDRLGEAREVAQMGAAIGREFSYELLLGISGWAEPALDGALQRLTDSGLAYRRGTARAARYVFKHALIQDAAYQSMLKTRRRQLHARIAELLKERYPQRVEVQPEWLAQHLTEAGLAEQAVRHWVRAAQRAAASSANREVVEHCRKGLALLRRLPATAEHDRQRLELWFVLGIAHRALSGFNAPQTRRAFLRAQALCKRAGDEAMLVLVLRGIYNTYFVRGEHRKGQPVAEQVLELAERTKDGSHNGHACACIGSNLFFRGELAAAREVLEKAVGEVDQGRHPVQAHYVLIDIRTAALMNLSWTLWILGYPDQAVDTGRQAISAARESAQPFTLAAALTWVCSMHLCCKHEAVVEQLHHELSAVSHKHRLAPWGDCATFIKGELLAAKGQREAGLMQIDSALALLRDAHARRAWSWMAAEAIEECLAVDRIGQALALLTEAFENVERNDERYWEAELYRLKGELFRAQAKRGEAEACFQQALAIARRQSARSLELRAAMSLVRLWRDDGKRHQALDLLAPVHDWFGEGFETGDLKAASSLRSELKTLPG